MDWGIAAVIGSEFIHQVAFDVSGTQYNGTAAQESGPNVCVSSGRRISGNATRFMQCSYHGSGSQRNSTTASADSS